MEKAWCLSSSHLSLTISPLGQSPHSTAHRHISHGICCVQEHGTGLTGPLPGGLLCASFLSLWLFCPALLLQQLYQPDPPDSLQPILDLDQTTKSSVLHKMMKIQQQILGQVDCDHQGITEAASFRTMPLASGNSWMPAHPGKSINTLCSLLCEQLRCSLDQCDSLWLSPSNTHKVLPLPTCA